jgi:hypothetical protein
MYPFESPSTPLQSSSTTTAKISQFSPNYYLDNLEKYSKQSQHQPPAPLMFDTAGAAPFSPQLQQQQQQSQQLHQQGQQQAQQQSQQLPQVIVDLPPPPAEVIFHISNHKYRFRDFRPATFQKLRKLSFISDEQYLQIISQPTKEKLSEGRSGAFFFICGDGDIIVKTVEKSEANTLLR